MTESLVNPDGAGHSTSLSLLDRARAKDQAAWDRLLRLYAPLVDWWARRAGLQDADAADVRQEVFVAVDRKLAEFRHDRPGDSFRGWLRTITQNKLRDFGKLRRADAALGGVAGQAALEQWAAPALESDNVSADAETQLLYRRALELMRQDFEPSSWQAFWRTVIDEQKPQSVADELQITVNAVYLAKARVLARLREEFADAIGA